MKNRLLWGILSIGIMIPCIVGASSSNGRVQGHPVSSSQYLKYTCKGDAIENFTCDYTGDPVVLRQGYGVEFYDTFYAGNQDRRMRGFCAGIIEPENNGDYNNGDNPGFVRTGGISINNRKIPKNTNRTIIQTEREYQIRMHPLQRSSNNLMVKYVVEYANSSSDSDTRYQHTECYPYIISRCGDGVVDENWDGKTPDKPAEQCDPEAPEWKNRSDGKICNSSCEIEYGAPVCSSTYNGKSKYTSSSTPWLNGTENLCEIGTPVDFSYSGSPRIYTWNCKNGSKKTSSVCVAKQERCGDGTKNGSEQCDPNDNGRTGRGNGGCNASCQPVMVENPECNSSYNGQRLSNLTSNNNLCSKGTISDFTYIATQHKWTWKCNNTLGTSVNCSAIKPYCGDGIKDEGEECDDGARNGTSSSSCSATCTNVNNASCGSLGGGHKYFSTKQTTPWLNQTSPGMCANGLTVGVPYITGTDSHLEWTCGNVNGTSVYCKAYQEYCGDGIINGGEECDGTEGCNTSCEKINQPTECNQTFEGKLRLGDNKPFTDTFNAGGRDRYLYYKEVIFKENHGNYDNNSNPNVPEFNWTSELVRNGMKVGADTSMVVIESDPYHIVSKPSKRADNNLYIEYTVWYDNTKQTPAPSKSNLFSHKECAKYAISRCGDGIKDAEYGEDCDPGSGGTSTLSGGQICNSECKIVNGKKGELDVEKTLTSNTNFVTGVGQELVWKVTVTAKGGDVENVEIKDYLPEILSYESMTPELPQGVTMKSINPTQGADATGNYLLWETEGTLKNGKSIILTITTKVKKMPKTTDDYENVACAYAEGVTEDCKQVPIETKGGLKVEKKIIKPADGIITRTGEQVEWKITVKAEGGNVKMEYIKDTLPAELQYEDYTREHIPEGITVEDPVKDGREIMWKTTGTLKSGDYIELHLLTKVVKMPEPRNAKVKNIACAKPDLGEETCATGETTRLWIKKYILDGNKEVKNITLNPGDTIIYKIKFGNDGNVPVYVSIKDFLPKGVIFLSGSLNVTYNSEGQQHGGGEVSYNGRNITIEGIDVALYSGVFLRGGYEGELIIYAQIPETLTDEGLNTTNFACIYNQSGARVDCDNAVYRVEEPKNLCERLDIRTKTFTKDGGSTIVKCTASKKANIVIDCGKNLDTISKSNVSSLTGECTYPSNSSPTTKTYNVECRVNNETSSDCKDTVTVDKSSGGGPSCFIAGTKVTMADGSKKNIEDVEIGEKLLGANGNVNTVLSFHRPLLGEKQLWSINGGKYFVTAEHPFMTTEGWKSLDPELTKIGMENLPVGLLKVGDILVTANGNVKISSLKSIKGAEDTQLYNFMLDGDHTYFADDYLVHNKCTNCDPGNKDKTPYCEKNPDDPICELVNPHCFNVNEGNFSIELGEYLPFYFNVYRDTEAKHTYKFVTDKNEKCDLGTVDLGSLKCRYVIRSPENNRVVEESAGFDCLSLEDRDDQRNDNLIKSWVKEQKRVYNVDLDDYKGKYWPMIKITDSDDWDIKDKNGENVLGEYKFQIEVYEYKQCTEEKEDTKWETITIPDRDIGVCQSNFVLTEPYTVQKTPSGNLTASTKTLDKFKLVDGNIVQKFSEYLKAITTSEYHPNKNVDDAMTAFIDKYEKLAVSVKKGDQEMKKVPGKNIYFINGSSYTINGGDYTKPFTFVQTNPNSTIKIKGDSNLNMMILTRGNIAFEGDCTHDQNVKGIFYASGNLTRLGVKKNTKLENDVWCTRGGLNIKGVLIGNNFNSLMKNSRSHLETWFNRDGKRSTDKQELTKKIMNGASVVIEYSPSIFTKSTMPPGAEDFTTALSIYKQ